MNFYFRSLMRVKFFSRFLDNIIFLVYFEKFGKNNKAAADIEQ